MGGWTRDRLPIVVGLILVSGAGVWVGWAYRLPPGERSDALVLPGFVLALAGVLVGLVPLLARLGRRPAVRPIDTLAELLVEAVDRQWRAAAHERQLVTPGPVPIRWSLSDLNLTGPVAAAVGALDQPPAFPPLPGHGRTVENDLQVGGTRSELHQVYAGLASGRVVVVGPPGAGKSGTAILLLLDALTHRYSMDDTQRARVPVPVLFTAHGWDPRTQTVQDWLADRLAATYSLFGHRGGPVEAAALVAARDKVALILDGLDEMDQGSRRAALQALSNAPFRVVVLTRRQEMIDAATGAWLVGAVAVHLHDLPAAEAADYLQRARTGPPPTGWMKLLSHLREHPDGVLARGLSTPLTLTLLRDTYQVGDDVSELLDATLYPTTDSIEKALIARVLSAAYTPQPGRPRSRYTHAQARQALTFIAQRLGTNRDLAWWHIPQWTPAISRMLTTGLVTGFTDGLLVGLVVGPAVGLVVGPAVGLVVGFVAGSVAGLRAGLTFGRRWGRGGYEPQQARTTNWRTAISGQLIRKALRHVLVGMLAGVLGYGLGSGLGSELVSGVITGLPYALASGLLVGLYIVLWDLIADSGTGESARPLDPREIWNSDRRVGLTRGLILGLMYGIMGLTLGLTYGVVIYGLAVGLAGTLAGLNYALVYPETCPTTLAWLQLQYSGHVPAVRLVSFLEDARDRHVLRTVGAVYQFRHATLQDQLAATKPPRAP